MKLLTATLATLASATEFTCGPMLTISNVAGQEALSGDWTIVMSQSNGGNPEIIQDHPYYKQNDGDLHMWWMWHPEQGESFGHWIVNDTPGSHGSDVIKSKYQTFACPQDNPTWFLPDGQTEVPMGWNGEFVVEPISCMCDKMAWSGDGVASGEWEKTDQWNDEWPVYKNEEQDLFMWWMWHGKQGHWVINATPGTHGNDQAKTVGFFDHKCATEFVPWSVGNNGEDFTIQCMPPKPTIKPTTVEPTDPDAISDEEFCKKAENQVKRIKAGKRGKIQRMGENSFSIRVKQPVGEASNYTALVVFARTACGNDFLTKLENGDILIDFQDVADGDSIFKHVNSHYRNDGDGSRFVMQFDKIGNCQKCLGSAKADSYEMVIVGTQDVRWGNKDAKTCLALAKHAFIGDKKEPELRGKDNDMIKCVAWHKFKTKNSNFSNWG